MKKEVTSHIQYSGWKYLAILLLAIALWSTIFTALAQPKSDEKVSIACFVDQVDIDLLSIQLNANKENITTQKLKEISAESILSTDSMLSALLATRKITSDLLIVGESSLSADSTSSTAIDPKSFVPFSQERLEQLLSGRVENIQFYYVEEYTVGIYLNNADGTSDGRFGDFYNGSERCVVFFSNESVNLGALYDVGESTNCGALDVLVYLLTN
jgi:hypothetical protein